MRAPKTWLITDTHFNHDAMIERGWRPAHYQQAIISNWQRLVLEVDTVYHLGDVILGRQSELSVILASLPGRKILIRGNHDHESDGWYLRAGFSAVAQGILVGGIWLTHAPQATLPDGAMVNVHGHLHDDGHRGGVSTLPAHCKLLAIEHTDYRPVELIEFVGFSPVTRRIMMPYEQEIEAI